MTTGFLVELLHSHCSLQAAEHTMLDEVELSTFLKEKPGVLQNLQHDESLLHFLPRAKC